MMEKCEPENYSFKEGDSCPVELHTELLKCKQAVYNRLTDIEYDMQGISTRVDELEASHTNIKKTLIRHENQRLAMDAKIDSNHNEIKALIESKEGNANERHTQLNSMIEQILTALNKVAEDTENNTTFIDQLKKYRLIILGGTTTATVIIFSVYKIAVWLQENGLVVFVPPAG